MHAFSPRVLPESLGALTELALDLRWMSNHDCGELWRCIDAKLWEDTGSPWLVISQVPRRRLDELARDDAFAQQLERVAAERRHYLEAPAWYGDRRGTDGPECVAYFSMEFGLHAALPLYAGGLGVLAGDYLKTASDLGIPTVGVGLLYRQGYFRQEIDASGNQCEVFRDTDPGRLPIRPASMDDGADVRIEMALPGRTLHLRAWLATIGRARLYLLDSDDPRNGADDRSITARLYGGSSELRLLQEMVLGIGGWTMLEALGIRADVCHLNEGHAALVVLERTRRFMRDSGAGFAQAWWATRAGNLFTTHTPVAAGFDMFPAALIERHAHDYLAGFGLPAHALLALGRHNPHDHGEPFNMTLLALRGCAQSNAVSRLHGEVSRALFGDLYPRWPPHEVPIGHVTNGVHVPSWQSAWAERIWSGSAGEAGSTLEERAARIATIDDRELWSLVGDRRRELVHYLRARLAGCGASGAAHGFAGNSAQALDPDILTLGFARRFAEYKRPDLLLADPQRLLRLLCDRERPMQLIVAGKAHPRDERGKHLLHAWIEFAARADARARVVFIEDYDLALAQRLVQGVDLWINTPRRPWEACGTSGMKTLVNGGLNLSEMDGWWAEAYTPAVGWTIGADAGHEVVCDDALSAERLYRLLEDEVAPAFYQRDADGMPRAWLARMRASMAQLTPRFSSERMLREYLDRFYRPAVRALRRRIDRRAALAGELSDWADALASTWRQLQFGPIQVQREAGEWRIRVPVLLGDIEPDWVRVEAYAAALADLPVTCVEMARGERIEGGYLYTACVPAARPVDHYTTRIRAWHADAFLPAENALITWQR